LAEASVGLSGLTGGCYVIGMTEKNAEASTGALITVEKKVVELPDAANFAKFLSLSPTAAFIAIT